MPDDLRDVIYATLIDHLPYSTADPLADEVTDQVRKHLASQVNLDDEPRLHRGASEAQAMTVDALVHRGVSARRITALRNLHAYGQITCDELEERTGLAHQSLSATLNWLERQGLAERNRGLRVRTRRGGYANPYLLTAKGHTLLRMVNP